MTTANDLRAFIADEISPGHSEAELTDDLALIDEHVIDSLGLFALVSFIESKFGVEILDEELLPENFGSIGAIARMIDTKSSVA